MRNRSLIAFALSAILAVGGVPTPALAEMTAETEAFVPTLAPAAIDKPNKSAVQPESDGALGEETVASAGQPNEETTTNPLEKPAKASDGELGEETAENTAASSDVAAQPDATTDAMSALSAQADSVASGTWGGCPWEISSDGTLTVRPGYGASQEFKSQSPWYAHRDSITRVVFASSGASKVKLSANSQHLFDGLSNVTSMDLSGADASSVSDLSGAFRNCSSLVTMDGLSGWDTSSVTSFVAMFSGCTSLASVEGISGWDTSSVTDMSDMFAGCNKLTSLDISRWKTSSVTNMTFMFYGCLKFTSLDLSDWDTSSVTDMSYMFAFCKSLASLNISGWDTSSVQSDSLMFQNCSPTTIEVGLGYAMKSAEMFPVSASGLKWRSQATGELYESSYIVSTRSGVADTYSQRDPAAIDTDVWGTCPWDLSSDGTLTIRAGEGASQEGLYDSPWKAHANEITKVVFVTNGTQKARLPANSQHLFDGLSNVTSMDLSGADASAVADMSFMFWGCSSLTSLNLTRWVTTNTKSLHWMFGGCDSLESLVGLTTWDTSSVTTMYRVFEGCSSLTSLDVSNWRTSSVTNMSGLFCGCSSLTSTNPFNLFEWDTSNVSDMSDMFRDCSSFAALDLSDWNTSSVKYMNSMFSGCSMLALVRGLPRWDTSSVEVMNQMFSGCSSLTSFNLSMWNTSSVESSMLMFSGCSPKSIVVGASYVMQSDAMFPEPAYAHLWRSKATGKLYTRDEIVSGRSGMADTYTQQEMETIATGTWGTCPWKLYKDGTLVVRPGVGAGQAGESKSPWSAHGQFITSVVFAGDGTSKVELPADSRYLFADLSKATMIDLANADTSKVTDMSGMFYNCASLNSIDLTGWDTSSV